RRKSSTMEFARTKFRSYQPVRAVMANSIAVTIIFLPQRTQRTQRKNISKRTKFRSYQPVRAVMTNSIAVTIIFCHREHRGKTSQNQEATQHSPSYFFRSTRKRASDFSVS